MSTPTDTFLSIDFLTELFFSKEFAQALTVNVATNPPILLHGARQLGPNTFQLLSKLGVGILEFIPLLLYLHQHPLAGLQLV